MRGKEVVISVTAVQNYDSDEKDNIEFSTDGLYSYSDGTARMMYFETEVTGLPGTRTIVVVRPDEIIVDRQGKLTSRMVFREGGKNDFVYDTPYGSATMGIRTGKIRKEFNESGGDMVLDYVLDMDHVTAVKNQFRMNVREIKKNGVQANG